MLKVTEAQLEDLEKMYPGIREQILRFENATLPVCTRCGSDDTAEFSIGLIGRSINIAGSTTRIRLIANGPKPAAFFAIVVTIAMAGQKITSVQVAHSEKT